MPTLRVALLLVLAPVALRAQRPGPPAPLQDNSFLIEEAYNQEAGVVQEISSFTRTTGGDDWVYTLTQEWPLGGRRHQLSYTLPLEHHDAYATTGLGDVMLNYRYQATGHPEARVLLAPRLSLLLPTGSAAAGRGAGGVGLQVNLPVTVMAAPRLATHWNAGVTVVSSARSDSRATATTTSLNLGTSAIWLVRPLCNLLVETVWLRSAEVAAPGASTVDDIVLLNPGFRWGFNTAGGLQIVTGLGYTLALSGDASDAIFAYLSFEHPFKRTPR